AKVKGGKGGRLVGSMALASSLVRCCACVRGISPLSTDGREGNRLLNGQQEPQERALGYDTTAGAAITLTLPISVDWGRRRLRSRDGHRLRPRQLPGTPDALQPVVSSRETHSMRLPSYPCGVAPICCRRDIRSKYKWTS